MNDFTQFNFSPQLKKPTPKEEFFNHLAVILLVLFLLWSIKIGEIFFGRSLSHWGLWPRTAEGLVGILTMPLLHGDFDHLVSNSVGLFFLGLALLHFYPKVAAKVVLLTILWGGLLVWLMARPAYHIGASGLIYGLSSFLFFSGLLRRDRRSVGAALIVAFLYGSAVWGVLPYKVGISWEGHLFGAIAGTLLALRYKNIDPPPKPQWEGEEPEDRDPYAWTNAED